MQAWWGWEGRGTSSLLAINCSSRGQISQPIATVFLKCDPGSFRKEIPQKSRHRVQEGTEAPLPAAGTR